MLRTPAPVVPAPVVLAPVVLAFAAALAFAAIARVAPAANDPEPLPSGMESLGTSSPNDLSRALAKVRRHYGDDAIVIESQLLMNAMRSGSVRATAVSVDGVRPHEDKKYLVFVVDTGIIFDSATRDETTRIHMLWEAIMAPTLEHLHALRVPADGIAVTMRYHHRPYQRLEEIRADLERPGTAEETAFYLLGPDVDALVERGETPHTLLRRAHVTVDGAKRAVAAAPPELPTAPGPD
jgi:hypothetical protein